MPESTPTGEHRATPRRAEDRAVVETVTSMATTLDKAEAWVKRWRTLLALGGLVLAVLIPYLSWAGATQSSPGQRLTKLEVSVDARFDTVGADIDSLRQQLARANTERDSMRADLSAINSDVSLTLRIICRPITDADLRQDCISRGARRR
jgi:hypothetical protein